MLKDNTQGYLSYRDKKFYYLDTGKFVYFSSGVSRLKQTLGMRGVFKIDDIGTGQMELTTWKEAKLKGNIEPAPLYLNEHLKKLSESELVNPEKTIWDIDG